MQPKIYSLDEHRLPPEKIDEHAYYIIQKLRQAGYCAFLVGGGVRDLLLNYRPKDYDISTSAKPEEIKRLFRNCILIGRRFRLAHIRFGKKIYEVSTFRAGDNADSSLIVQDNVWGTAEEDALRRDFTINGLFYDVENQTVIDYVEGFPDLEKKMLRTIGDPIARFKQDPVRMIRLLKFRARFGFEVDPTAQQSLNSCKEEILKSSPARVLEELIRMLESGASEAFFQLLTEHGLLHMLMPHLAKFTEDNHENEVYRYLREIDIQNNKLSKTLQRPILISSLIFPLVHKSLIQRQEKENRSPHLGLIAEEVSNTIDKVFHPFFHIPRRMKATMIFLLTSQFRFVPLEKKRRRTPRIPRDSNFPLALDFFKIRCALEPDHLKDYSLWHEALFKSHQTKKRRKLPPRKKIYPVRKR